MNSLKHRPVGQIRVVRHKHTAMIMNWLLCAALLHDRILLALFSFHEISEERSKESPEESDHENLTYLIKRQTL